MAEEALLKYAQPFLIGIGLIVVLNLWSIIQAFLSARRSKDGKTEAAIEKLTESVTKLQLEFTASQVKLSARVDRVVYDLNNIGGMVKNLRKPTKKR